jgi:hypothetical protein
MNRLIGTATFLLASALALQHCSSTGPADTASGGAGEPQFKIVATTDQVMDAIIIPHAQAVWDAVVYENGKMVSEPKTEDDWYNLQMHAYAVAEAGNLLKMAPRAKDEGEWMAFATALTDRSMEVVRAAEKKDVEGLLTAGGNVYNVCTDCHRKYVTPDPNAPDPPVPGTPPSN